MTSPAPLTKKEGLLKATSEVAPRFSKEARMANRALLDAVGQIAKRNNATLAETALDRAHTRHHQSASFGGKHWRQYAETERRKPCSAELPVGDIPITLEHYPEDLEKMAGQQMSELLLSIYLVTHFI